MLVRALKFPCIVVMAEDRRESRPRSERKSEQTGEGKEGNFSHGGVLRKRRLVRSLFGRQRLQPPLLVGQNAGNCRDSRGADPYRQALSRPSPSAR